MPTSQKQALFALVIAVIMTGGAYWLFENALPNWVYLLIFFVALGSAYSQGLKDAANKKIADQN